jgi:hypothetical protein
MFIGVLASKSKYCDFAIYIHKYINLTVPSLLIYVDLHKGSHLVDEFASASIFFKDMHDCWTWVWTICDDGVWCCLTMFPDDYWPWFLMMFNGCWLLLTCFVSFDVWPCHSWAHLGFSWPILGGLGTVLGHLGPALGHLGLAWSHLGPSWGHLGASLGPSWAILGPSWAILSLCRGNASEIWGLLGQHTVR